MIEAILSAFTSLVGLGGKMVLDKDKQAEYANKALEMANGLALKLLDTKTYPWVDALVKLAYASDAIIKGLFRPLCTAVGTAYFMMHPELIDKLHSMGTEGDLLLTAVFGSFPAWMASRHQEKKRDSENKGFFSKLFGGN